MSITTPAQANNNLATRVYRAYRLESRFWMIQMWQAGMWLHAKGPYSYAFEAEEEIVRMAGV